MKSKIRLWIGILIIVTGTIFLGYTTYEILSDFNKKTTFKFQTIDLYKEKSYVIFPENKIIKTPSDYKIKVNNQTKKINITFEKKYIVFSTIIAAISLWAILFLVGLGITGLLKRN